ncbi:unnamed protein product [Caenorhabditis bovis]|uniref:Divalent-cation tolerance protein CutA n=1 Tax=Caenorhabditis bovis TaxID=2654633 RepID=A0A8S1ENI2_9PELO|nr:unnamed protein product [Caenorhabditis bovis]
MSTAAIRLVTVLITVPTKDVGLQISRSIVTQKLAACVNIIPSVTSVYVWEGKLEESDELMMVVKTTSEKIAQLQESVTKLHPYDVPEFIVLPIEHAAPKYASWIATQTGQ